MPRQHFTEGDAFPVFGNQNGAGWKRSEVGKDGPVQKILQE